MEQVSVRAARTPEDIDSFRVLTREYYEWLGVKLDFQGIEEELSNLPGVYARPKGDILLAVDKQTGKTIGAVAVKPLKAADTQHGPGCEMKRLFVSPAHRGRSAGFLLVQEILKVAKQLGYQRMVLDSLDRLQSATKIYRAVGFEYCDAYYDNPLEGVVYLSKDLSKHKASTPVWVAPLGFIVAVVATWARVKLLRR